MFTSLGVLKDHLDNKERPDRMDRDRFLKAVLDAHKVAECVEQLCPEQRPLDQDFFDRLSAFYCRAWRTRVMSITLVDAYSDSRIRCGMQIRGTIKLAQFSELLGATYREVNYVLERGFVPEGVDPAPSTGHHRAFDPGQAYWLAIVLLLKRSGIRVPQAAQFADRIKHGLRGITQNLGWDWTFFPWTGKFDTEHRYVAEIGDGHWLRILTDANPSARGKGIQAVDDWSSPEATPSKEADFAPFVVVRIDLSHLAAVLREADWSVTDTKA
jgi:hypothetical protein